jgi:hypothetical protein
MLIPAALDLTPRLAVNTIPIRRRVVDKGVQPACPPGIPQDIELL